MKLPSKFCFNHWLVVSNKAVKRLKAAVHGIINLHCQRPGFMCSQKETILSERAPLLDQDFVIIDFGSTEGWTILFKDLTCSLKPATVEDADESDNIVIKLEIIKMPLSSCP